MKITPENQDDIVTLLAMEFPSFGGGQSSKGNPIAAALESTPAAFAAGVDIKDVVRRVCELEAVIRAGGSVEIGGESA